MKDDALLAIRRELDRVAEAGRRVDVWWRDDDAVRDGPALDRLLRVANRTGLPAALAVIPALVEPSLVERVREEHGVGILVHGLSHADHAPADAKAAEFGAGRPRRDLARDAAAALALTVAAFGDRALPVFVPPWNRIDRGFAATLPGLGFEALSAFGETADSGSAPRIDTHLDPVDWRGSRGLVPAETIAAALRRALAAGARQVGLLSHHLVHDEELWSFCEGFAVLAASHPATRPVSIVDLLRVVRPSSPRQGFHATGERRLELAEVAR